MRPAGLRSFLVVTVPVYLCLLWVASCISRPNGAFLFLGGVAALLACLFALRRGRRGPLFSLYLVMLLMAMSVLSVEGALRLFPNVLTGKTANCAYNGYHDLSGGIYRRDRFMGLAMKPNCRREIYWNGHWWLHESNAAGYRGRQVNHADAVFLGDSMIYGHGVENDDTVSSRFADHTSLEPANLGQQGTCAIQYWLRLCDPGLSLHPRFVFVCCHPNDIDEAPYFYSDNELYAFLARPLDDDQAPVVQRYFQPRAWWRPDQMWNDYFALPLRAAGALSGLQQSTQETCATTRPASAKCFVPDPAIIDAPFAPWEASDSAKRRLGWEANLRALEKIAQRCRQQGATLVLFDIGYPRAFSRAIEKEAARLGVRYSPAGRAALDRALAGEETYLANDGHWSAHGCDVIAVELAKEVR
jgi:hypothetical protein